MHNVLSMNKSTFMAIAAVLAVAMGMPVMKREGPVLALPGSGETTGNFLSRLLGPIPLIGSLPAGLGLPPAKPN
ncbi:hypothetical protein GGH96_001298 [Coemansia sp. RSA 1972]|nr:hypothetical protein GGH96_001298 [Coemansia sp. RSA 1972]